jgi:hypothetical protein
LEGGGDMNGRKNKGRKNGSILIALLSGLLLIALGGVLLANRKYFFGLMEPRMFLGEQIINATVCFVFGAILLYWVYSSEDPGKDKLPAKDMFNICEAWSSWGKGPPYQEEKQGYAKPWDIFYANSNWGIGFPTVTMVVTVLTAVIVIFTFTHELFKHP